ncbi:MAG TPA: maleylpyruvate isomerase N-terminal domain-containing protein [Acidimicrobiales bacterium]|nr:maleylpyruvate isomerase N-terminal domain-containing protein [Acidimicrobiales bacterium]
MLTPLGIDCEESRQALAAVTPRTGELLRSAGDGAAPVKGSNWTLGEVGAHMAVALVAFTLAVQGETDVLAPYIPRTDDFAERLRAVTSNTLALEPQREPGALGDLIERRAEDFLSATADRPGDQAVATPWYGERTHLSVATATAMLVGEQLMHGYDIARTIRAPWPISSEDARLVIRGLTSMLPLVAKPAPAGGADSRYDIRIRGGPRFVVQRDKGKVTVEPSPSEAPCCYISADPVAFLLVAYGRANQWGPVAKGRLVAGGRRPWRALRFKNLFYNP